MIDNTTFGTRTAKFHTLGCKLNFAETSTIAQMFADKGIRRVQTGETPDVVVVNTCSVTELADKKCRQAIRRIGKQETSPSNCYRNRLLCSAQKRRDCSNTWRENRCR